MIARLKAWRAVVTGKLMLSPITRLGLLYFQPDRFVHRTSASHGINGCFGGALQWVEIPRSDTGFFRFLSEAVSVLESPQPPTSSTFCPYCQYLRVAREGKL